MRVVASPVLMALCLAVAGGCSRPWPDATMRGYLAEHEAGLNRIAAEAADGPVLMSNIRYYDLVDWLPRVARTSESVYDALKGVSAFSGSSNGTYWPAGRMYLFLVKPVGDDSRGYRALTMVRRDGGWLVRSSYHGINLETLTLEECGALVGMTAARLQATIDALDSLGSVTVSREFPRRSLRSDQPGFPETSGRVVGFQLAGRTRLFAATGRDAQAHLLNQGGVRHLDGPWFYGDHEAVR